MTKENLVMIGLTHCRGRSCDDCLLKERCEETGGHLEKFSNEEFDGVVEWFEKNEMKLKIEEEDFYWIKDSYHLNPSLIVLPNSVE